MTAPTVIDQEILGRRLLAIAEEMGIDLLRNAFSSIVREAKDMSTAVFDRHGALVAQADQIPMLLSTMTTAVEGCLARVDIDDLGPDTILVTNDPYRGGQHLSDIVMAMPVFHGGERIGFVGSIAHHVDMGGAAPGILGEAADVFEEGIRIPPLALRLQDGRLPSDFVELVAANVRTPAEVVGDLNAQLAALFTGSRGLAAVADRHGAAFLREVMRRLLDSSEAAMRAVLAAMPDFDVEGEARLEDDGIGGDALVVHVRLLKTGDALTVDFDGSSAQRACMMNANYSSTLSGVWTVVREVFGSRAPMWHNAGAVRPVTVQVPDGSFLNATWPASIHGRTLTSYRVYDAMMLALREIVPEQIAAEGFNTSIVLALSRVVDGSFSVLVEVVAGGWGGRGDSDGPDALPFALSNCANTPAEYLEIAYPFLRIESYSLLPGSAGAGEHRGGLGEVRRYEILADDVFFSVFADRFEHDPAGAFGGAPGTRGRITVERDGVTIDLPSKGNFALRRGDRLTVVGGGGAGYGPPERRDPDKLRDDVRFGADLDPAAVS